MAWGPRLEAKELVRYYSWEGNVETANARVAPACEALRAKGIEATVDVYAGSLKKAVRSHTLNGDVHLIVTRAAMDNWIGRLFDSTMSIFRALKRPSFSSVMLINPRTSFDGVRGFVWEFGYFTAKAQRRSKTSTIFGTFDTQDRGRIRSRNTINSMRLLSVSSHKAVRRSRWSDARLQKEKDPDRS